LLQQTPAAFNAATGTAYNTLSTSVMRLIVPWWLG
jgi:hypothetical protein